MFKFKQYQIFKIVTYQITFVVFVIWTQARPSFHFNRSLQTRVNNFLNKFKRKILPLVSSSIWDSNLQPFSIVSRLPLPLDR